MESPTNLPGSYHSSDKQPGTPRTQDLLLDGKEDFAFNVIKENSSCTVYFPRKSFNCLSCNIQINSVKSLKAHLINKHLLTFLYGCGFCMSFDHKNGKDMFKHQKLCNPNSSVAKHYPTKQKTAKQNSSIKTQKSCANNLMEENLSDCSEVTDDSFEPESDEIETEVNFTGHNNSQNPPPMNYWHQNNPGIFPNTFNGLQYPWPNYQSYGYGNGFPIGIHQAQMGHLPIGFGNQALPLPFGPWPVQQQWQQPFNPWMQPQIYHPNYYDCKQNTNTNNPWQPIVHEQDRPSKTAKTRKEIPKQTKHSRSNLDQQELINSLISKIQALEARLSGNSEHRPNPNPKLTPDSVIKPKPNLGKSYYSGNVSSKTHKDTAKLRGNTAYAPPKPSSQQSSTRPGHLKSPPAVQSAKQMQGRNGRDEPVKGPKTNITNSKSDGIPKKPFSNLTLKEKKTFLSKEFNEYLDKWEKSTKESLNNTWILLKDCIADIMFCNKKNKAKTSRITNNFSPIITQPARIPKNHSPMLRTKANLDLLYLTNPKKVFRLVTEDKSNPVTTFDQDTTCKYFNNLWNTTGKRTEINFPKELEASTYSTPFTKAEVKLFLKRANLKSAKGPDGITFKAWQWFHSAFGAKPLLQILNKFLEDGPPEEVKKAQTILLIKNPEGNMDDISNYRPISITNTIYRIFTGMLTNRLQNKIKTLINESQRGFLRDDGILLNVCELNEIFARAREQTLPTYALLVDFKKAFDKIDHAYLIREVQKKCGNDFANLVSGLLNAKTIVNSTDGTHTVNITNGVRQGCPLSPLLFNIALDNLIVKLQSIQGVTFRASRSLETNIHKISVRAYADDVIIYTTNTEELEKAVIILQEWCKNTNMEINYEKTMTIVYPPQQNNQIMLAGCSIPIVQEEDTAKYLGIRYNHKAIISNTHSDTVIDMSKKICQVLKHEQIHPSTKLKMIRTHILPMTSHAMRLVNDDYLSRNQLDLQTKTIIKMTFNFPKALSNHAFFSSTSKGGMGLTSLVEDQYLLDVARAIIILNKPGTFIHDCYRKKLIYSRTEAGMSYQPTELADLLNLELVNPSWPFFNKALGFVKELGVKFVNHEGLINIIAPKLQDTSLSNRRILSKLRYLQKTRHEEEWEKQVYQGESRPLHANKLENVCLNNCTLPAKAWAFTIKARSNTLVNKDYLARIGQLKDEENHCRRCGTHRETLFHIMNNCPHTMVRQTTRHRDILDKLIKSSRVVEATFIKEKKYPTMEAILIPDLLIRFKSPTKDDILIDVTCPFDFQSNMQNGYDEKINKYSILVKEHSRIFGKKLVILPFVIGSLGAVHHSVYEVFNALDINAKDAAKTLKQMITSNLVNSYFLYVAFMNPGPMNNISNDLDLEPEPSTSPEPNPMLMNLGPMSTPSHEPDVQPGPQTSTEPCPAK